MLPASDPKAICPICEQPLRLPAREDAAQRIACHYENFQDWQEEHEVYPVLHDIASVCESLLNVMPTTQATADVRLRLDALRLMLNQLKTEGWIPARFFDGQLVRGEME